MSGNSGGWQPGIGGINGGTSWNPGGWQPGVEGMSGYPDDWYNVNGNIPCPARDCYMVFDSSNIHNLASHWNGPENPALSKLTKAEHYVLFVMLNQGSCPLCGVATAGGKYLYSHEKERHKSSMLSNLEGFVRLVRYVSPLRGHQEWAHQAIFQRLAISIRNDVALIQALNRRQRYEPYHYPGIGIDLILSPPGIRSGGPTAPVNTPIPADDFLRHLPPTTAYLEQEDTSWADK